MGQLDSLFKEFNRKNKDNIAFVGIPHINIPRIPFSSPRANYMLYGGIPRARIVEFFGEEGGGKTTTALDIVANAQKLFEQENEQEINMLTETQKLTKTQQERLQYLEAAGSKKVVYVDCENTLDIDWARKLGVDVDSMYLLKPQLQSAEEIFQMIYDSVETGEVGLVIIDSLGVMISKQTLEKTMEEKTYAGISQALTTFSNKITPLLSKTNCTIIGINQMRQDMTSPYSLYKTPGGQAWKHACTVRMMFQKGQYFDANGKDATRSIENPRGHKVNIKVVKTKCCKPNRLNGFYTLNYEHGIDSMCDLVEVAIQFGLILQSGAWYQFVDGSTGEIITDEVGDEIKIQGKPRVIEFLNQDSIMAQQLQKDVEELIKLS